MSLPQVAAPSQVSNVSEVEALQQRLDACNAAYLALKRETAREIADLQQRLAATERQRDTYKAESARAHREREDDWDVLRNAKLEPADRLVALSARRFVRERKVPRAADVRHPEWAGSYDVSQADIARDTGLDASTVSRRFDRLQSAGIFTYDTKTRPASLSPSAPADAPRYETVSLFRPLEPLEHLATFEPPEDCALRRKHGGKRVICPMCDSTKITVQTRHRFTCVGCGNIWDQIDEARWANEEPEEEPEATEEAQPCEPAPVPDLHLATSGVGRVGAAEIEDDAGDDVPPFVGRYDDDDVADDDGEERGLWLV